MSERQRVSEKNANRFAAHVRKVHERRMAWIREQLADLDDESGQVADLLVRAMEFECATREEATRVKLDKLVRLLRSYGEVATWDASGWTIEGIDEDDMTMRQHIYAEIDQEREAQDQKWGGAEHDDLHDVTDWVDFIYKHAERATTLRDTRVHLIRVAALAVAAIESLERDAGAPIIPETEPGA